MTDIETYLHRNLVVGKAVGVRAGLHVAMARLVKAKRRPKWLLDLLDREYGKMGDIIDEAIKHRDEYSRAIDSYKYIEDEADHA